MKNFNGQLFLDDVSIQNWNATDHVGTNDKFNDFVWRLEGCVDRHAPFKKLNRKEIKKQSKPWVNSKILKMISHRNRLFLKKKNDPSDIHIKTTYNLFRNRVNRELKLKLREIITKRTLKIS